MMTANSNRSTRRRRSSRDGKNDPARSLGIRRSRSPAVAGQGPDPVPVAVPVPGGRTLVRGGADYRVQLDLD